MSFQIKENDTTPSLRASLLNGDGNAVDLLGTTIRFFMRALGSSAVTIDRSASIISQAEGIVQYDWVTGDTASVGFYQAEFQVTYADGNIETFPNGNYIGVEIIDDISQ